MSKLIHIKFWEYEFLQPQMLWLLILIPILLFIRFLAQEKEKGSFKTSRSAKDLKTISFDGGKYLNYLIYLFFGLGLSLLIMAFAKPFNPSLIDDSEDYGEGIDIIISLDISGSMLATDFLPNRLEAAKEVAKEFVDNRKGDRIGLVVYEGEAYTACPATRNHDFLKTTIDQVQSGWLEPGTAIGTGLGTAVARLRTDTLASKVVILLSDGENNKGKISPKSASELAKQKNVRVYTIGVGKEGYASMPVNTPFGPIVQNTLVTIDEKLLKEIANNTGGKYFRATDKESLREVYQKIDKMEKTLMVETNIQKEPPYHPLSFLMYGLLFVSLAFLIDLILYKNNA